MSDRLIAPAELAVLLRRDSRVRLLDVRTPGEFAGGHIPGAYNAPLDQLAEHARELRATPELPLVLVCQSGARARRADELLRGAGMANLRLLEGGVAGWRAAGLAVTSGPPRVSLERQVRIAAGGMAALGALLALVVHPLFALLPLGVGSGLVFAGVTDTCFLAMLLARLPYNRAGGSCDVGAMARALRADAPTA